MCHGGDPAAVVPGAAGGPRSAQRASPTSCGARQGLAGLADPNRSVPEYLRQRSPEPLRLFSYLMQLFHAQTELFGELRSAGLTAEIRRQLARRAPDRA
jgi:hypothetical protein